MKAFIAERASAWAVSSLGWFTAPAVSLLPSPSPPRACLRVRALFKEPPRARASTGGGVADLPEVMCLLLSCKHSA